MALEIKWTPQADKGLAIVIGYLEVEWTFKEILQLEENITPSNQSDLSFP